MSDSPTAAWKEVERLVQAERYEEAKTAYMQFIERYPKQVGDAYKALLPRPIVALYRLEECEHAISQDPRGNRGYWWCQKGQFLAHLKRYTEALAAYEQAIQHARELPSADVRGSAGKLSRLKGGYKGKGTVLSVLQRYEEALAVYEQLIQLDPADGDGYKGQGEMLSALQRQEEAGAVYEQALAVYEQALHFAAPSSHLAFPILEVQQRLHRSPAPAGRLNADILDNDLNGTRFGSQQWRTPAVLEGAILEGQQGRYQVAERLRDTTLTTHYRARDVASDRPVLVKVLYPRVLGYLCTTAPRRLGLSDPHLEHLLGYGTLGPCCYLVTELLEGPTLRSWMARESSWTPARAVAVVTQIAEALEALVNRGMADGALDPATIVLLGEQGLKLTDPGLHAAWMPLRKPMTSSEPMVTGSEAYLAPECARGEARPDGMHLDLYALTCLFFELLAGFPPYQGKHPLDVAVQHVKSPIPSITVLRPDVAPAYDAFFQRALAKHPADRYQTPRAWREALAALPIARICVNQERLAQLIQTHQDAMRADEQEDLRDHRIILTVLQQLANGMTYEDALSFLNKMATIFADRQALYRQTISDVQQMYQEEQ